MGLRCGATGGLKLLFNMLGVTSWTNRDREAIVLVLFKARIHIYDREKSFNDDTNFEAEGISLEDLCNGTVNLNNFSRNSERL